MRPKLNETELMKYWIDSEFSLIHSMIAFIATLIVQVWWQDAILWIYIVISVLYSATRIAVVAAQDRDYLRIPKIDPDIVRRPDE